MGHASPSPEAAVPAYTLRDDDPASLRAFVATLGRRNPKTVAAYLAILRDLVAWLATLPEDDNRYQVGKGQK